jgi:hypothetical protein
MAQISTEDEVEDVVCREETRPACELGIELVHGEHGSGEHGDIGRANEVDQGMLEKDERLTRGSWVWSERLEEGQSSRISPETVQDEEDDVFCSGQIASILRA